MSGKPANDLLDTNSLLVFIWRRKVTLLLVAVIAIVISLVASLMMDPVYESTAILYPSNSKSKIQLISGQAFGYEVDAERLVQMLDSEPIRDSIIEKFNLLDHYDIDTSKKTWKFDLYQTFEGNVDLSKTVYMSVKVAFTDTDPQMAADIVNEMARLVNVVRDNIIRENTYQTLKAIESEYFDKLKDVSSKNDSLIRANNQNAAIALELLRMKTYHKEQQVKRLRDSLEAFRSKFQIFDYGYQVNVLNKNLAKAEKRYLEEKGKLTVVDSMLTPTDTAVVNTRARMEGAKTAVDHFQSKLADLTKINGIYTTLVDQLLKQFGGLQAIQKAGVEDLSRIEGISEALAQQIYDVFHEQD